MSNTQKAMLEWAAAGLGWRHMHVDIDDATSVASFVFPQAGSVEPVVIGAKINPTYWALAATHEQRLRVAFEAIADLDRICRNGGFDPRNPPRADQEAQDVQDARHDEVQQDQGRRHPDPEGAA